MAEKIPIRPATIIIKNEKILAVKSKYGNEEFYLFPGGGIKKGETIVQAAIRETLEETGYLVEIDKPLYINEYIDLKSSRRVVNIFFLARIKKFVGTKTNDKGKVKSIEWIPIKDLVKIDLKPEFIKRRIKKDCENNFIESVVYSVDYKNGQKNC